MEEMDLGVFPGVPELEASFNSVAFISCRIDMLVTNACF